MSLIALSKSTLSGCWVSLVIGFSYFLCRHPPVRAKASSDTASSKALAFNKRSTILIRKSALFRHAAASPPTQVARLRLSNQFTAQPDPRPEPEVHQQ